MTDSTHINTVKNKQMIIAEAGERLIAIPAENVISIERTQGLEKSSDRNGMIYGVFPFDEQLVKVINAGNWFGVEQNGVMGSRIILFSNHDRERLGLLVDRIVEIGHARLTDFKELSPSDSDCNAVALGSASANGTDTLILDSERIADKYLTSN